MKTRIAIVIFWIGMSGWLVRYEAFPEKFIGAGGGYRSLFNQGLLVLDSWAQIYFKATPVGYSHTWIDSNSEGTNESYTVRNQTVINLKLMGQVQRANVSAGATLDAQYRLQHFFAVLLSDAYSTRLEGQKTGRNQYRVRVNTRNASSETSLTIPDDVILYSPMTELAVCHLQPGESLAFKAMDPLSMSVSDVSAKGLRQEVVHEEGRDQEATVIQIAWQGLDTLAWVNPAGRILRQETPFGLMMRACKPEEIIASGKTAAEAQDLVKFLAVPCTGQIANPRDCRTIAIRLNGQSLHPDALASPRQAIETQAVGRVEMTVRAQRAPKLNAPLAELTAPQPRFLAASAALQSDHPAIVKQARAIVGDRTNSFAAANAICDWVYRNVAKRPAISLPSALDVLERREGDCNEHTYLFVALARAAGLPAQINVGLVYALLEGADSAFYYHAWPEVFVGEWVEMDPTFGQATVDATHIRLAQGELPDQMQILGLIGRLNIELLAEE